MFPHVENFRGTMIPKAHIMHDSIYSKIIYGIVWTFPPQRPLSFFVYLNIKAAETQSIAINKY